ncbi:MAG: cyclase family protein [Clostridiales bacterium]|nr:cyclase family protein [Clostridiales bacterium]
MKIYDITHALCSDTPVWPGDPPVSVKGSASIDNGDVCNLTSLVLGSHAGTHMDAPYHVFKDGKRLSQIELELLIGDCLVIEILNKREISRNDIEGLIPKGTRRLLIKTSNSQREFYGDFKTDYASVDAGAVEYILSMGVRLLGVDYLSLGVWGKTLEVHNSFFTNGGEVIVESLNLRDVPGGEYELVCLPMKLSCEDGAPVRCILREKN